MQLRFLIQHDDGYTCKHTSEYWGTVYYRPLTISEIQSFKTLLAGESSQRHKDRMLRTIVADHLFYATGFKELELREFYINNAVNENAMVLYDCVFENSIQDEDADQQKLYDGVRLHVTYPSFVEFDCSFCGKNFIDPTAVGSCHERPLVARVGVRLCDTHEGCPSGTEENNKRLSAKHLKCLNHFHRYGRMPTDDPITLRNWRVIRRALHDAKGDL